MQNGKKFVSRGETIMSYVFPSFNSGNENNKKKERTDQENSLKDVLIPYCVQVGKGEVSYEKLTQLSPGDLLPLNISCDELFELKVGHGNKKTICRGHIVEVDQQLYFQMKRIP